MNWLKKKYETSVYLESVTGRFRISKSFSMGGKALYTLWDMSPGHARPEGNFDDLDEAKKKAENMK